MVGASKRIYDLTTHNYSPYDTNWPINAGKPDFVHTNNTREVTTQDGVYLTTRLSLADPLKLILGGRLDWYDYDNRDGDGDYKVTRNVTRYAGLIYELDDHHSVYASYSDIFTPQSNKGTSGNPVKPIVGKKLRGRHQGRIPGRRAERQPRRVPRRSGKPRGASVRPELPAVVLL